jgi:hypothetical protein
MKDPGETNNGRLRDVALITRPTKNSPINGAALRKLVHDLHSAANAFHFTVDTLVSEMGVGISERQLKKIRQLRQHVTLNFECIELVCQALVNIQPQDHSNDNHPHPSR